MILLERLVRMHWNLIVEELRALAEIWEVLEARKVI